MVEIDVFSVSDITERLKQSIEVNSEFSDIWLEGEISGLTKARSGHIYLTVKDSDSSIKCVFFKNDNFLFRDRIVDNSRVLIYGSFTLYRARGDLQFIISHLESGDKGPLWAEFERRRERLTAEGLFDLSRKRPLPKFPKRILVVTSPTGAVIEDIRNIVSRRWPLTELIVEPTIVQGIDAAQSISSAIKNVSNYDGEQIDLVIVARGGGSVEDLWAFNEEVVVRSIYTCPVPVISAIGHETDFTLADLVADQRAPTPSGAAELAVPDRQEVLQQVELLLVRHNMSIRNLFSLLFDRVLHFSSRVQLKRPASELLEAGVQAVTDRMSHAIRFKLVEQSRLIFHSEGKLDSLSPSATLSRGYALVSKEDAAIRSYKSLVDADRVLIHWHDGFLKARIEMNGDSNDR
jgi:exodeoxyribonuclease VII large subunit